MIVVRALIVLVALAGFLAWPQSTAMAEGFISEHVVPNTLEVVKIEEDWELRVSSPDSGVTAPQVTTAFSPLANVDGFHAIFNLNHQALDEFSPGGMQLQLWNGDTPIGHQRLREGLSMQSNDEVVTWTQQMEINSGVLVLRIVNGHSATWQDFGGESDLVAKVSAPIQNLNAYEPNVSIENSGVVFASNRVASLILKTVRAYTSEGKVFTITVNADVVAD